MRHAISCAPACPPSPARAMAGRQGGCARISVQRPPCTLNSRRRAALALAFCFYYLTLLRLPLAAPEKRTRRAAGAAMAVTTPICVRSSSSAGPWSSDGSALAASRVSRLIEMGWQAARSGQERGRQEQAGSLYTNKQRKRNTPAQCAAQQRRPGRRACGAPPPPWPWCWQRHSPLRHAYQEQRGAAVAVSKVRAGRRAGRWVGGQSRQAAAGCRQSSRQAARDSPQQARPRRRPQQAQWRGQRARTLLGSCQVGGPVFVPQGIQVSRIKHACASQRRGEVGGE